MAQLDDLLKYKKKVTLKNQRTGKDLKTVWVRILGDDDMKEAFQQARIASAAKRKELRDTDSPAYQDEIIGVLKETPRDQQEELILASKENEFANNAPIVVPREDAPKIEEIAVEPDAPTLEEQERLDDTEKEQNEKFRKAIDEYIETKLNEVRAGFADLTDDRIFELATVEYINIQSLQAFLDEINQQKAFRGTYMDEDCKERGYSSMDSFRNADSQIKAQLIVAYSELEVGADDLKN